MPRFWFQNSIIHYKELKMFGEKKLITGWEQQPKKKMDEISLEYLGMPKSKKILNKMTACS
jgi:hypothetical protein